jgi:hypothetical protein
MAGQRLVRTGKRRRELRGNETLIDRPSGRHWHIQDFILFLMAGVFGREANQT